MKLYPQGLIYQKAMVLTYPEDIEDKIIFLFKNLIIPIILNRDINKIAINETGLLRQDSLTLPLF